MTNLINRVTAEIGSWLREFQVKRFLAVVMLGLLLVTTNVGGDRHNQGLSSEVLDRIHQNDADRPKTTGEWNKEARQVEGRPGKRIERIAKESSEAVKEFGDVLSDTATKAADDLKN